MAEPAVLLLHGQPGSAKDWSRVRSALGAQVDTIALDRPGWNGHGSPTDLAGNARAALASLEAGALERAIVVGHSLGAAVAVWLAAEHPERVAALVLAAPAANLSSLNRLDRLLASSVLGPLLSIAMLSGGGLALLSATVRERMRAELGVDDAYLRAVTGALLDPRTWRAFTVEQRMLVRELPALEPRLRQISAPATVVIGTADRIVSPSAARELASQIPGAQLVQLPGATHLLPQQRPLELAEAILRAARPG